MSDLTPNNTPNITPNASPDVTPGTAADPESRRPADDRTGAVKRGEAVPADEAARSAEARRSSAAGLRGTGASTGATGATGATATGATNTTGSAGEAVRSGDAVSAGRGGSSGGRLLPGEKGPTSAESRATTAVGEPTPLAADADTAGAGAARGRAAGAERDTDALRDSDQDGASPRHREPGAVDTVAGRVPTTAAAEPGGHGASLLPVDECDRIASRMRHAVVGFVDAPRDAVSEADQVLEELAARFTDAVDRRRRTLRGSWQSAEGAKDGKDGKDHAATAMRDIDTEQLRLALRDYRELTERLLHL
ncbi:hypothetical protein ACFWBB_17730 [Streptomyces sp. NPDC060000]|uniref:hypothetical protein n=1 Tax=Streptomyces sp. NPDC060000 TaxID=3347031 RepID=UPI00368076D8